MKKKLLLCIFLFPILSLHAQKLKTVKKKDRINPYIYEKYQVFKKKKKTKHGTYTMMGKNGTLVKGTYSNNKRTGIWTGNQSDGKLYYNFNFDNDSLIYSSNLDIFQYNEAEYDTPPILIQGDNNFLTKLYSQIRYPSEARIMTLQGKVTVSFIVNESGKISEVKLKKGIHESLDKESIRVITKIGSDIEWIPATKDGQKIKAELQYKVNYKLM